MKFAIEHPFTGVDLPAYEALYFDEPFNEALCAKLGLQRTVNKLTRTGARLQRVCRIVPQREIPAPEAKLMGDGHLVYTETLDYSWGSMGGTWKTVTDLLPDKVLCAGNFAFVGQAGGGVMRRIDGEVKVKIFAVGGMIERFIVADVERSYAAAATFTQAWIDGLQGA